MKRAARRCAGWTAVLIATALVLTACGSTARHVRFPVSKLCVDVGLPTSGIGSVVGRAVLAGLEEQIPRLGRPIDGYLIGLCDVGYAAGPNQATASAHLLANAAEAASHQDTIAYVGVLPNGREDDLAAVGAVLGEAGIPLITPSGPDSSAGASANGPGAGGLTFGRTTFYLLPSTGSQADAERAVGQLHNCGQILHHRETCTVLTRTQATLCSGIAAVRAARPQRLCVLAGPDLSRFDPPAIAYGNSAGELLEDTFAQVGATGGDIANRGTVLRRLIKEDLKDSLIGPIRFDSAGAIRAHTFTVYTVQENGRLAALQTFSEH